MCRNLLPAAGAAARTLQTIGICGKKTFGEAGCRQTSIRQCGIPLCHEAVENVFGANEADLCNRLVAFAVERSGRSGDWHNLQLARAHCMQSTQLTSAERAHRIG